MKSPEDKHKLIPDEHAPIVQRMYRMALEGKTCTEIAYTLKQEHIPTPGAYTRDKNGVLQKTEGIQFPLSVPLRVGASSSVYPVLPADAPAPALNPAATKVWAFIPGRAVSAADMSCRSRISSLWLQAIAWGNSIGTPDEAIFPWISSARSKASGKGFPRALALWIIPRQAVVDK